MCVPVPLSPKVSDRSLALTVKGDPVLARWIDVFEMRSAASLGKGKADDVTKLDPTQLGIEPVKTEKDAKTGFVIAGKNATDLLKALPEIHGRTIAALEKDMRPGALARAGFLGPEERLLDVLVEDNRFVVEKHGLTHQELARHLHLLGAVARKEATVEPIELLYHGRRFQARAEVAKAKVESPFQDGTSTNVAVTIWNLDNGTSLTYSLLVPHLIERYGFYEGHGTSYRVPPKSILDVLDFLRPW
jgi:hypothetical protein